MMAALRLEADTEASAGPWPFKSSHQERSDTEVAISNFLCN